MGYYRGDVFRGDYYQGDPGLFSFVGKAARGLLGTAANLTGVGRVATAAFGLVKSATSRRAAAIPTFAMTQAPPPGPMRAISRFGQFDGGTTLDGQPFGPTLPGGGGGGGYLPTQGRHRALHWNKAGYVTRGGGTSRWPAQLIFHPRGTEPVPSRRMNVGNARALRHALHRISGFAHLARRVMSFTHPGHGRGRFKFHRKKKR